MLIKKSYTSFSDRPNRTNLDLLFDVPEKGIWQCYLDGDKVAKLDEGESVSSCFDEEMVRKWRWTTIGKGYDWTSKEYNENVTEIPNEIAGICQTVANSLGFKEYEPNAGIINFYQFRDSLTGHVDRSEVNHAAPLVSISLGESGIFLLGGESRNSEPIHAIVVRSGDVLVMSGACRLFFHGIPRIVENDLVPIYQNCNEEGTCDCNQFNNSIDHKKHDESCWSRIYPLAKGTRINLNVRQFQ